MYINIYIHLSLYTEEEERPLTDIRFRVSVRGWNNKTHQSLVQSLLDKEDKGRERLGVGPIATKIVVMARKDRRILGGNSRGSDHHGKDPALM